MPQNIQPEVFIKMVLSNWELQNTRMNNLLENLTDEQLASETAPGRNTGMYLLEYEMKEESLIISGTLSLSELFYEKIIETDDNSPTINLLYTIKNISNDVRHFLWKLHAALQIKEGDQLMTTAKKAKVVDTEYSRFASLDEFVWPMIEGVNASIIPSKNNTMDFFYLYDTAIGEMELLSADESSVFRYSYDKNIFPYQWYFASYEKFLDHYSAILEPCTAMPISVNDAIKLNQCSVLKPNEELNTVVKIYAGSH